MAATEKPVFAASSRCVKCSFFRIFFNFVPNKTKHPKLGRFGYLRACDAFHDAFCRNETAYRAMRWRDAFYSDRSLLWREYFFTKASKALFGIN
jgi:hypothetical protein